MQILNFLIARSHFRDNRFDRSDTSDAEKKTPSQDVIDDSEMDIGKSIRLKKYQVFKYLDKSKMNLIMKIMKCLKSFFYFNSVIINFACIT